MGDLRRGETCASRDPYVNRPPPCVLRSKFKNQYRGTSLIRNAPPVGPYSRTMPSEHWDLVGVQGSCSQNFDRTTHGGGTHVSSAKWLQCEDRIGTGPPRARTNVIYVDLGCWAISGSIHPKGDPRSWGINSSVSKDRIGTGPPRARTEVIYVDLGYWAISGRARPDTVLTSKPGVERDPQLIASDLTLKKTWNDDITTLKK